LPKNIATAISAGRFLFSANLKHEALLTESTCAMLDWGWNDGESFELGASQPLSSMRLLGILFIEIGITIGIDQVLGRFLLYLIPNPVGGQCSVIAASPRAISKTHAT